MRIEPRSIERDPGLGDLCTRGWKRLEAVRHHEVVPLDLLRELACLALAVEDSCGDLVTLAARNAAVGMENGPVQRDEIGANPGCSKSPRAGDIAHHECVT